MILFFDTSALVKFFHREEGTDVVVSIISDLKNEVWVSELARLEFICALHRRLRMNEINEDDLNRVLDGFYKEYSRLNTKKIGRAVLNEAEALVKRLGRTSGLRALDSIHLATFNLFDDLEEMLFVAADDILITAAKAIGAKAINPLSGPEIIMP
ncbi:MAG: type II toxin-antitoxin system VapC family toxin [Pseudomonadota bacterium]